MTEPDKPSIDSTSAVREGEQLDDDRLREYLAERLPELKEPLVIEQFRKGHSNLTYLVRCGSRQWVLRRPPFGAKTIKKGHDMSREYRILSGLVGVYDKVPRPLIYCDDESVIGAPFYLMERLEGVILRGAQTPAGLDLSAPVMQALSTALIDGLAELHAVDVKAAGLADYGRPAGYARRQVEGWTERYLKAKTDEIPEVEQAAAWLADNLPAGSDDPALAPATLIHNDYKYDNLVLHPDDPTHIIGVLDWEMATIGDPLMDLGTTLGYWIDPADDDRVKMLPFGPTMLDGNLDRMGLVARYGERSGRDVSNILFYYVYALVKTAGVAQQIYRRYKDGFTKDGRFAMMILGVRLLGEIAARAIDRGRISDLR